MRKIPIKSYYFLGFCAISLNCCKPDDKEPPCTDPANPECENYDPCFGKIETTAFFTIAQRFAPIGVNADTFITDDVVIGGMLKFSAVPQEGATYTWILGIDTLVGGPEVTTTLGNLPYGSYPNSLIVTKTPDSLCFPGDAGTAVFTRAFTLISPCEAQIIGKFKGIFTTPVASDSVEIEFALSPSAQEILPCNPNSNIALFFVNANMLNDTIRMESNGSANKIRSMAAYGAFDQPEGLAFIDEAGIIHVDYILEGQNYLFKGRKL